MNATNSITITHKHSDGAEFRITTIALVENGTILRSDSSFGVVVNESFTPLSTTRHQQSRSTAGGITTCTLESGPVGGAMRVETLVITPDTAHNTEVHQKTVLENNVPVSNIQTTWTNFVWGWEKTQEIIDPGTGHKNLTNSWTYNDFGESAAVATYVRYDGYQELHTYDTGIHTTNLPFADDVDGLTLARVWDGGYTTLTTTRTVDGNNLSKETESYDGNIKTTTIYADDNTPLTITTYMPSGSDFGGEPASILHQDGTLTTYEYTRNEDGGKTVTVKTGVLNGDGTTTTTTYSAFGTPVSGISTLTVGENTITTDIFATVQDGFGRAVETTHFSGTEGAYTTTTSYNCCGVETITDRHGVTTSYEYDGLGRQTKSTTLDVTTETVYDGLTTSIYRYPIEGAADVTNHTNRIARTIRNDLAGTSTTTESPDPSAVADGEGIPGALTPTTTATTYSLTYNEANPPVLIAATTTTVTTVPDGTQTTITYPDGRTASTYGDLQPGMAYGYDVSGTGLITASAYIGGTTETTVTTTDWAGRTVNITRGGTESTTYAYYSSNGPNGEARNGKLASITDADLVKTLYEYNSRGERTTTALDVNGNGNIDYGTDQITRTETYPSGSYLETATTGWVMVDDPEDDPDLGPAPVARILSVTRRSPDGLITESWTGDPATAGNQPTITESTVGDTETQSWTETTTRPDGSYAISFYVGGRLHQTISYDSEDNEIASTTIGYGDYNRPVTSTDSRTGTTTTAYVSATCDAVQSVTEENGNDDRTTSYTYDSRGRRTTVTHPDTTSVTSTSYNSDGTVLEVSGAQTYHVSYTYDYAGRKQTMTTHGAVDATTTWYYYAHTGRLKEKLDNSGKGPLYTYTDAGRLATRTSARGRVTSYGYEGGRLMSVDYFGTDTHWDTYLAARITWLELIAEEAFQDDIDTAEAVMNAAYAANAAASDQTTPSLSYTRDTLGRILTVTRGGAAHATYTYDPSTLQLTTEVLNRDSSARTLNRYYDPLGRPLSLKVGTDYTTAYGFDTAGRINRVWDHPVLNTAGVPVDGNEVPLEIGDFSYGYQAASYGLIKTVTGPAHTVTNTWETTRDVLASKVNAISQNNIPSSFAYGVNVMGQRTTVSPVLVSNQPVSTYSVSWGWGYNGRGELESADHGNDATANTLDRFYSFDGIGNRDYIRTGTYTDSSGTLIDYTANPLNQYTRANDVNLPAKPLPAPYDLDGNLRFDGGVNKDSEDRQYIWDAENRLIAVNSVTRNGEGNITATTGLVTYQYDHLSRLISRTTTPDAVPEGAATTNYLYDGFNLIAQYTGTTLTKTYTWGMDLSGSMQGAGGVGGLLAVSEHTMNGETHVRTPFYPTFDGNGNVSEYLAVAIVNNAPVVSIAAHYEYDAFGNDVTPTGQGGGKHDDFSHRFSTKPLDKVTGWYYYQYRYMDPLTGRWTSPDPIGEQGGMNLYVFVGNDGVDKNDVLGMWTDLKREGRPWATICAEKDDTWKGLADILHLETFEADKWIRNYDGPWPDSGKLYEVPNTFVVYTAKRPLWTGLSPLDVERMALFMFAYQAALGFKDVGYNVIEHYNADSKAVFESLWKSDGIMGIAFSGHGMPSWKTPNRITGYLSEPTTGRTSSPRTVGPPPYNLAVIMAFQCGGYEVGWQKYLSINKGTFIGFSGTITGIDIAFRAGNGKIVSEQMDDEPNP